MDGIPVLYGYIVYRRYENDLLNPTRPEPVEGCLLPTHTRGSKIKVFEELGSCVDVGGEEEEGREEEVGVSL